MPAPFHPPVVSVVIPAFNAEASIDAALDSVFAQTYRDFEVVVVDDGSTDGTAERLEAWRDRVTVLRQPNAGPGRARNAGIRATRGRLLAFLDADDVWLPDKLARQVAYFRKYPQTGLLHTAALNQSAPPPDTLPGQAEPAALSPPRGAFCDLFHTDLDVNTLTVMAPREVVEAVGLFDERREVHVEDWDLWLRIAARYPVGYLPCATAVRRPGGVMSRAFEKTFDGQAAIIRKTLPTCASVCPHHASNASACVNRRWHRLWWERGYARLRAGDRRGARHAFLAALRYRPSDLATYLQIAGTIAGSRLRRAASRLRGNRPEPSAPAGSRPRAVLPGPSAADNDGGARQVSLVHDTLYRRSRHAAVERLHDLDERLGRHDDRRRLLFQAASPMSFVIFRPVYEQLRADRRLDFWFTAVGSAWEPGALYERVGIREHVVPARAVTWMKVDACINADFWDTTWLRRRTRRLHLFHGVAGKYGLDAPLDIAPIVASYDRLFFPNRDRLDRYLDAGLVDRNGRAAVLAGYPKVDCLVNGTLDVDGVAARLALDRRRPTVIYAPTWSPHSSLNVYGEAIMDQLASAGFNVIVKLHDRSYDLNPRASGGIDWAARLAVYRDHPLVRIVTDPDSTPYLGLADAMVTDHSSVGFEFALLDRPIVVLDCPELIARARVTESKVLELRSAAEVVSSPAEVVAAVERQLRAPRLHTAERRSLAGRYFYCPGSATARVTAGVYEVLGLSAPESSPAWAGGSGERLARASPTAQAGAVRGL